MCAVYMPICLNYPTFLAAMKQAIAMMTAMMAKIEAENAKLRELVEELYPLADYGAIDSSELDRAHDLMRDLGTEVNK